ncbi:hypothetical protein CPB85DRAFT_815592 [Mucidula mucida]|nr:hypothetical protein CPB85DRAFT_815592 [Mucidula mucida]
MLYISLAKCKVEYPFCSADLLDEHHLLRPSHPITPCLDIPHDPIHLLNMQASAVSAVVSFLTDALVPFYDPAFLHAVRLHLQMSLPAHFKSSAELSLSSTTPPPPVIVQVPLAFAQWMFFLGSQPIRIVASSTEVKAVFANRTASLWREDGEEDLNEHNVPSIACRNATSTRPAVYRPPIRLPSPPLRASAPAPIVVDDDSSSDSSSDVDSDDGYLSEDSMTSVSSTQSVYSVSKPVHSKPSVPPITYLYQGGKTNVVTGGVMLGASSNKPAALTALKSSSCNKPFTPAKRQAFPKARRVLLGPDSSNWRRRD